MQPGIERRTTDARRIPLDLWVRLSHEDYAEPFDADGVDLSRGGLALRSDYLPEVGDRLLCRFDSPPDGGEVEVDGEVVWAHDAGERSGEFGLRFTEVDAGQAEQLAKIVSHFAPSTSGRVRLHLDGVATPVEADMVEHDDEWLTAEQALPFLRLGMGVVVEGSHGPPRGRLRGVDVRIEDGVPRLVLQVDLEQALDDTLDAPPEDDGALLEAAPRASADATLADFVAPVDEVPAEAPRGGAERGREAQQVRVFAVHDEGDDDALAEALGDAGDGPSEHTQGELQAQLEAQLDAALDSDRPPLLARAREQLAPMLAKGRAHGAAAMTRLRPALTALWAKLVALAALARDKGGPLAAKIGGRAYTLAVALGGKLAQRIAKKAKRRTTAAPPKRVAESPRLRRQRLEEAEVAPPKKAGRRIALLSALAFAGVGTAVYALAGDEEAAAPPAEVASPAAALAPTPPPVAPAALPSVAAAPAADPEGGLLAEAPEPTPPVQAGRLEEPTFPSLRDANTRRDEAPIEEGTSFGASSVENGRSRTIRMSQPVTTLRGQAQEGGFTVTIPGSLALDRAGPLAAANPSIERATILNRGDHAVLTIRFVAGRTPPYRVVARGSAVELTIGR